MSAAEEDTELRDLLIQTLENSGVLNKIKAELRASVFLALEEQEKVENKIPLVNESLKKFLNARDGRLIASLFSEFLQFFNLDFTLAVFQPEACLENGPDDRSPLARDLGIIESEGAKSGPLILELVKRWRQKDKIISGGEVTHDVSDIIHSPRRIPEGKTSAHGTYSKVTESSSESSLLSRESKKKSESHTPINTIKPDSILNNLILDSVERNDLELDEDDLEGDSFFDDPIPKPEKTYCWRNEPSKLGGGLASLSAAPPLNTGLRSHQSGAPRLKDPDKETQLASLKDLKAATGKIASLELGK
ncbi:hypothetical protein FKM82_010676 [Ascaphus truei]